MLLIMILLLARISNAFWPFDSSYNSPAGVVLEQGNSSILLQGQTLPGVILPPLISTGLAVTPAAIRYSGYVISQLYPGQALKIWSAVGTFNHEYSVAMTVLTAFSLMSLLGNTGYTGYLKARSLVNHRFCRQRQGVMPVYTEPEWLSSHFSLEARFEPEQAPSLVIKPLKNMKHPPEGAETASTSWYQLSLMMTALDFVELTVNIIATDDHQKALQLNAIDKKGSRHTKTLTGFSEASWGLELLNSTCSVDENASRYSYSVFQPEIIRAIAFAWESNLSGRSLMPRAETIRNQNASVHAIPGAGYHVVHSEYSRYLHPSPGFLLLASDDWLDDQLLDKASQSDAMVWASNLSSQSIWQQWTVDLFKTAFQSCFIHLAGQAANTMLTPNPPATPMPKCLIASDNAFGADEGQILVDSVQSQVQCSQGMQAIKDRLAEAGCLALTLLDPAHQKLQDIMLFYAARPMFSMREQRAMQVRSDAKTGAVEDRSVPAPTSGAGAAAMKHKALGNVYQWLSRQVTTLSEQERFFVFRYSNLKDRPIAYEYLRWMVTGDITLLRAALKDDADGADLILSAFLFASKNAQDYVEGLSRLSQLSRELHTEINAANEKLVEKIQVLNGFEAANPIETARKLDQLKKVFSIDSIMDKKLQHDEITIVNAITNLAQAMSLGARSEPGIWFYQANKRAPSQSRPTLETVEGWSKQYLKHTSLDRHVSGFEYLMMFSAENLNIPEKEILKEMTQVLRTLLNTPELDSLSKEFYAWVSLMYLDENLLAQPNPVVPVAGLRHPSSSVAPPTSPGQAKVAAFLALSTSGQLTHVSPKNTIAKQTFIAQTRTLTTGLQYNLQSLLPLLVEKSLISASHDLDNQHHSSLNRASTMVAYIRNKIELNYENLITFIDVLNTLGLFDVAEPLIDTWKQQSGTSHIPLLQTVSHSSGRNSREYRTFIRLQPELQLAIKSQLTDLGGKLLAASLITSDDYGRARNPYTEQAERAASLLEIITTRVSVSTEHYHTFVGVLEEDYMNQDIVKRLQKTYQSL